MARSEARTDVDIWQDPDFLGLCPDDQRMYWFLYSQRDIAHTGVIALRLRRWAQAAAGLTVSGVQASLERLAAARFVVVDWDAEELLVRSFLRRDKVYRQPNVLRSAADTLTLITSPIVRYALAVEVERISRLGDVHKDAAPILADMLSQLAPSSMDDPPPPITAGHNPSGNPSADPSEVPSGGSPGDRGVVTVRTTDFPDPRDLDPHPPAAEAVSNSLTRGGARGEPPPNAGPAGRAETLLAGWRERRRFPVGDVVIKVGMFIRNAINDGHSDDHIRETLARYDAKNGDKTPALLPYILDDVANGSQPGALALARASPNVVPISSKGRAVANARQIADQLREEARRASR